MLTDTKVRVDKWLWAVRIYKTRSMATDACRKGRILIEGQAVRPSRILKQGDIIQVRRPPVLYQYRVTGLLAKRLSARLYRPALRNGPRRVA